MTPDTPDASSSPAPLDRTAEAHPALVRSRRIAWVLDDLVPIPGTRFRIGLDPILGLVPGGGDTVSWAISLHLLWTGWRMGAGPATLARMAGHLLVDAAVGAVPAVGDLFDIAYRANDRNLAILEDLALDAPRTRRVSVFWLAAVAGGSSLVLGGVMWGVWKGISALAGWVF